MTVTLGRWELIAFIAAVVILLSPVLYLLTARTVAPLPAAGPAVFVGSEKCQKCHETAYKKWLGSDHDRAMDEANDKTVLGDFNNVSYTDPYNNITSRFFRKDGRFFVETEGPDGLPGIFEITHTFGFHPLQQYLVPFPGGRLQCLTIAWDVKRKTWYRLPPYDVDGPEDWLHWTRGAQTWNEHVRRVPFHSSNQRAIIPTRANTRLPGLRLMSGVRHAMDQAQNTWSGRINRQWPEPMPTTTP